MPSITKSIERIESNTGYSRLSVKARLKSAIVN